MLNKKGVINMEQSRIIQLENMIAMRLNMNKKFGSYCSQEEIDELQKELEQAKLDINEDSS
tara:strand:- start:778 stop:960 length:183 start_codon:yes stop_codon:yes gene_type:complete